MAPDTDQLSWNADNIAQLMFKHKIRSRGALAKELGVSRSTVNDSFDDDWRGRATSRLINLLARHFGVLIGELVIEPAVHERRQTASGETCCTSWRPSKS
jgi:hypothetical protein